MGGDGTGDGLFLRRRATNTPAMTIKRTNAALAPPRATNTASEKKNNLKNVSKENVNFFVFIYLN